MIKNIDYNKEFIIDFIEITFKDLEEYMHKVGRLDVYINNKTYCFYSEWENRKIRFYAFEDIPGLNYEDYNFYDTFEEMLLFKFSDGKTFFELLTGEKPQV